MIVRREFEALTMRRNVRRIEAALRESERRCEALLDSSRDPIAYVHEGMHVRANKAYLEMFGFDEFEDVEGMSILDMIAPDDADDFKALLKRLSKGEKPPQRLNLKAQRGDGIDLRRDDGIRRGELRGRALPADHVPPADDRRRSGAGARCAALEGSRHRAVQPPAH